MTAVAIEASLVMFTRELSLARLNEEYFLTNIFDEKLSLIILQQRKCLHFQIKTYQCGQENVNLHRDRKENVE